MNKPLAIGIEDYKELIQKGYYYVDKTFFMKELLDKKGKVNLFTRPRRFGKTLALSMLKTYFEMELDEKGVPVDNRHYFDGMKIMKAGQEYTEQMGRYPVIFLSLKSAKQPNYELAYAMICDQMEGEYKRHKYVLQEGILQEDEKQKYQALMNGTARENQMINSLQFLSSCLKKYHRQNVIILIDEYDVPLENAYFRGFYDRMIDFIRSLFESALKTNDNLEFAVITGCLRISRESIFTGLNNLKIMSVMNNQYAEYFGFTQQEIEEMLDFYGIHDKLEEAKEWYNGYRFGKIEVYNPWSMINYVDDMAVGGALYPRPYWSNTSSNNIVRELIERADAGVRKEIENLIAGESIKKPVHEDITYGDIYESQDNLWNFLFFTGYLKMTGQSFEEDSIYLTLTIPNKEVRYIYKSTIREWFDRKLKTVDYVPLHQALTQGDSETFAAIIKKHLRESISYYDTKEAFYHGFLTGLFSVFQDYELLSNRESGNGRPDLMLKPYDELNPAIVIEIKVTDQFSKMDRECEIALEQIKDREYNTELLQEGYHNILEYGICFCKKSCMVKNSDIR